MASLCAGKKAGDEGLREGVMKLRADGHTVEVSALPLSAMSAPKRTCMSAQSDHFDQQCHSVICASAGQVRVTWEPEDVDRYIAEALKADVHTIVAAGQLSEFPASGSHTFHCIQYTSCRAVYGELPSPGSGAGGDGSVNQVAGALVRADAPENTRMAVIPLGTANDFATGLGIPEASSLSQSLCHDMLHQRDWTH